MGRSKRSKGKKKPAVDVETDLKITESEKVRVETKNRRIRKKNVARDSPMPPIPEDEEVEVDLGEISVKTKGLKLSEAERQRLKNKLRAKRGAMAARFGRGGGTTKEVKTVTDKEGNVFNIDELSAAIGGGQGTHFSDSLRKYGFEATFDAYNLDMSSVKGKLNSMAKNPQARKKMKGTGAGKIITEMAKEDRDRKERKRERAKKRRQRKKRRAAEAKLKAEANKPENQIDLDADFGEIGLHIPDPDPVEVDGLDSEGVSDEDVPTAASAPATTEETSEAGADSVEELAPEAGETPGGAPDPVLPGSEVGDE